MDKVKASTVAGGVAGMVGGVLRKYLCAIVRDVLLTTRKGGPKNIVPGIICFSVFGGAGQLLVNVIGWKPSTESATEGFLKSKWSPVTFLADEDYQKILEEKLLRVEVEIAIVDDNIKELREAEQLSKKQPAVQDPQASPKGHK